MEMIGSTRKDKLTFIAGALSLASMPPPLLPEVRSCANVLLIQKHTPNFLFSLSSSLVSLTPSLPPLTPLSSLPSLVWCVCVCVCVHTHSLLSILSPSLFFHSLSLPLSHTLAGRILLAQ